MAADEVVEVVNVLGKLNHVIVPVCDTHEDVSCDMDTLGLPEHFEYDEFEKEGPNEYSFTCYSLNNAEEIKNWVKLLGKKTAVKWRVATTYPHLPYYRIQYRCKFSQSRAYSKCPAQLCIKQIPSDNDLNTITRITLKCDHHHTFKEPVTESASENVSLPENYQYEDLCRIGADGFHVYCKDLQDADEIKKWVKLFGEKTFVEWRVSKTYPHRKEFGIDYRCQHSPPMHSLQEQGRRKSKTTNCPAQLKIRQISLESDCATKTTHIVMKYKHNHSTGTAATLQYRDVGEEARNTMKDLFYLGHTPASAYAKMQYAAYMKYGEDYHRFAADRKHVPNKAFFYKFFASMRCRTFEGETDNDTSSGWCDAFQENSLAQIDIGEETELPYTGMTSNNVSEGNDAICTDAVEMGACNEALLEWEAVNLDIKQRIEQSKSPDMIDGLVAFCRNYKKFCKTDAALQASLGAFGKCNGVKVLSAAAKIGVQPTKIVRQKSTITTKRHENVEHTYRSQIEEINFHDYSKPSPFKKRGRDIDTVASKILPCQKRVRNREIIKNFI